MTHRGWSRAGASSTSQGRSSAEGGGSPWLYSSGLPGRNLVLPRTDPTSDGVVPCPTPESRTLGAPAHPPSPESGCPQLAVPVCPPPTLNPRARPGTYPAAHVLRAAAQLLALQVGELCRQVPGGQLVFRLRLNDHLWEGTMQGALN